MGNQKKRRVMFDQCGGICYLCGNKIKFFSQSTLDHVYPKARGGKNNIDNLRIAHFRCNKLKGDTLIWELDFKIFKHVT